jgi:hypothetical protein
MTGPLRSVLIIVAVLLGIFVVIVVLTAVLHAAHVF